MEIDWLTEAISTAFINTEQVVQPVPVISCSSSQPAATTRESKEWIDHYRLLQKRRALHEMDNLSVSTELQRAMGDLSEDTGELTDILRKTLKSQLALVQRRVNAVRAHLATVPKQRATVVNELALAIDEADKALGEAKRSQAHAFRALMTQEQTLEAEIEDAANRMAMYEERRASCGPWMNQRDKIDKKAKDDDEEEGDASDDDRREDQHQRKVAIAPKGRPSRNNGCLAPEVVEFENFVQKSGGDSGGWDSGDHEEFVKIVKACNGDYLQAIAVCEERAIGYTHAEIVSHANWHMDYLDLLVRKRNALAKWREEKEREKSKVLASAALLDCQSAAEAKEERAMAGRSSAATTHEQQVQKEMVLKWKQQKEAEMRRKEEERAEAARRQQERKMIEIEERQLLNKMKIEAHREAKERADKIKRVRSEIKAMDEASCQPLTDPVKAWRVEERNNSFLRRRHSLIALQEEKKVARQEVQARMLDKVRVEAPADPKRLLKGTSSHINRVQENQSDGLKKEPVMSGNILKVPHLAKAGWMANR
jgi:hypothetical protein